MIRYSILILALFSIISGSCSSRKNKAEHKDIIPEKDLISILTEVHIADGLLSLPKIRYIYSKGDTLSTYIDIFKKYGYTKEQMDRTMRFYFIQRPKKLIEIYDKVLGGLSVMESRVEKEIPVMRPVEVNLWPGETYYSFPDPSGNDSAWFDIPILNTGIYTIKFTLTIYPDDQTVNPRIGAFFYHPDSTESGNRNYFSTIVFIKDGHRHTYSILKVLKGPIPVSLKGWFIDYENQPADLVKHMRIEKIALYRSPIE
jgi:hypothetical protein